MFLKAFSHRLERPLLMLVELLLVPQCHLFARFENAPINRALAQRVEANTDDRNNLAAYRVLCVLAPILLRRVNENTVEERLFR